MPIESTVIVGPRTEIMEPVNIYGDVVIGEDCRIGPFVEIQSGARIGNRVKIGSHTFICRGVTIEDEAFIGHGVMFTNDRYPRGTNEDGTLKTEEDWTCIPTWVGFRASVGSGAVILPGADIDILGMVGAGAVVTKPVLGTTIVVGNPAHEIPRREGAVKSAEHWDKR